MTDWDAGLLDEVAAEFGRPAMFRPAAGPAVAVAVILSRGDRPVGSFAAKAIAEIARGEIRRAEVDRIADGDTLDVGADRYRIRSPSLADAERLVWSFGLERLP